MTKVETVQQMAASATQALTAQIQDWCRFLVIAGRFYKYRFLEQVLIYTQRPTATACASYDLWNSRMRRRIRRGRTGIALLYRGSDGKPALRYVFDVADTVELEDSLSPEPWQYSAKYHEAVTAHLAQHFQTPPGKLEDMLIALSAQTVSEAAQNAKAGILEAVKGSGLDGQDEDAALGSFAAAATVSLAFLLLARCGYDLDAFFTKDDFAGITNFTTRKSVLALGNTVSDNARVILRQIETAIRDYDAAPPPSSAPEPAPVTQAPAPPPKGQGLVLSSGENGQMQLAETEPPAVKAPAPPPRKAARQSAAANFRITDDALGAGGPKARYAANVAAIRLLKRIEGEERDAAPEEQEVLSRYVGWGAVADAFDPDKGEWAAEYAELKELLTPAEYESASGTVLNAHYTSPAVIRAIYEAVSNLGFQTGNILEPACGVGNFFRLLPEKMNASRLYGVELDSISGRIAQKLYPKAQIAVQGYEQANFPKDFFDLAVGNVPFGQYQVNDPAYNKLGFSIHNYFFAKALDQLRPGGILAFVTSRFTMDAKDGAVRRYLAQRADLLGAIRLPNTAFKANAGTDVVSDILFLQKREEPVSALPDWVSTQDGPEGYLVNRYFLKNPEMVLGVPGVESTRYGQDYTVRPTPGGDLAEQLRGAVAHIHGQYRKADVQELDEEMADTIPADPAVKNFSFTVVNGEVYYRENSVMVRPKLNATAKARVRGLISLRDCLRELIQAQMDNCTDDALACYQRQLNTYYNSFTAKYGLINARANRLAFDRDSAYYLLCSLEVLDDDGKLERKADIFTKRTIRQHTAVTYVDTAQEALAVSIGEKAKVDVSYMARLTGKAEAEIIADLRGQIYRIPGSDTYVAADEYLSGNVRRKLRSAQAAAEQDPAYQVNVDALTEALPKDLEASEISVRLGATWIGPSYIQQFMEETLNTPMYLRQDIQVLFSPHTAEWSVTGKGRVRSDDVAAYTTYGIARKNAYEILEDTLNLRDVRIYDTVEDPDGKERRVINGKQTTLAVQKQQALKAAFQDWLWRDPGRRQALVRVYNDTMNAIRPREYDGSHIVFHGINPEIKLQPHQLGAIAHALYGGNTLFAHEVGAGKTFEMIATAMEAKHLGLCTKSIFVVPNHLTQQTAAEFLRLYPAAHILVTTKRDFETAKRKKFCARIATGDWDAVIIGHSQFEMIPISLERQKRLLDEQIADIEEGIRELKASKGEHFTVKQMERMKKSLCVRLEKLMANHRKDDVVTFEQLGVDMMFVDESDNYKNLFLYTKMSNVAGLSTSDAQKSSDMFSKCRYLDELTGGRGVVFATGTPISNSMTELYTLQRYLQYDRLEELGMGQFDSWASRFGETVTALELAPEGTGYRARTRFARFYNLPELMALFKEVADIKTADQLKLPTPAAEYHSIVCEPTEHQKLMVKELSKRAEKVHNGSVDAHVDNMLRITGDGRKLGLDQRIINPTLPDDPGSKVNRCVANVLRIWREGQTGKLTQLIFCDLSTPAKGSFNVYDDLRAKLVSGGMPPEQVVFIHEANTDEKKKALFAKVRSGQVRVLIGSTQKMGAGTNVQDRLVALHDLDCPWRPRDLTQRAGRIVRRGNRNEKVHIYRYVTSGTFDAYLWQTVENKQKFISQVMTSKTPLRSCEDVDEAALSYAEIKALCAGDPRIKERMELDVDVTRLKIMKADHQSRQYRMEDDLLKHFPAQVKEAEGNIAGVKADIALLARHPLPVEGFSGMEVEGRTYTDKLQAGQALTDSIAACTDAMIVTVARYRGFDVTVRWDGFEHKVAIKGSLMYRIETGSDARGNITRLDNALAKLPDQLPILQARLEDLRRQIEAAKAEVGKVFPYEEELAQKSARLAELDAALNIGGKSGKQTA